MPDFRQVYGLELRLCVGNSLFSLWVTYLASMGFDFFMIVPSYHLTVAFLFLDIEYLFWYVIAFFLLMVVKPLAVIFVFL